MIQLIDSNLVTISGAADTEQELKKIRYTEPITQGYLYLESSCATDNNRFEVWIRWHNGSNFMKWHRVKDTDGQDQFDAFLKEQVEIDFNKQATWKYPVYGFHTKVKKLGTADVKIYNGLANFVLESGQNV